MSEWRILSSGSIGHRGDKVSVSSAALSTQHTQTGSDKTGPESFGVGKLAPNKKPISFQDSFSEAGKSQMCRRVASLQPHELLLNWDSGGGGMGGSREEGW